MGGRKREKSASSRRNTPACKSRLGIELGDTTKDGLFTLKEAECLGACVNAPIVAIHDYYHEDLTPDALEALMDKLARGEKIEPGSAIGRQNSAPQDAQKTLIDPSLYDGSLGKKATIPGLPEKAS